MKDFEVEETVSEKMPLDWAVSLQSTDSEDGIFQEVLNRTSQWMTSEAVLWWLDPARNGFRLISYSRDSKALHDDANFFPYEVALDLGLLKDTESIELPARCKFRPPLFNLDLALACQINYEDRSNGILMVLPGKLPHSWSANDRELLSRIARTAADLCNSFEKREKLTRLIDLLEELSDKTQFNDLFDLVLSKGRTLFNCDRGVVRGINWENGQLAHRASLPKVTGAFDLEAGEGVVGLALEKGRTYRIPDVTAPKWEEIYRGLWPTLPKSRSELAVPIIHRKYRVREGTQRHFVDKPFGVLNFESPTIGAFSALDQYCAERIAQRMAPVMERIEYDSKLGKVRTASQNLATKKDWDTIVDTLLAAIRDSLGYEFVSLSIVDQDAGVIRCERVIGLPKGDPEGFCREAVHSLNSNHVQPEVVRHNSTDVPDPDEPRLSPINKEFGLDNLIRAFVPMTDLSTKEVIGTVSAGYDRSYRKHIYWRDLQLLRILVSFGTNAMLLWPRNDVDRVLHEINAPLSAVRANIERLLYKRDRLNEDQIDIALEDMETDSHVLYQQARRLAYLGGRVVDATKQPLNIESVALFKDVIIKTVSQLKSVIRDEGLDPKKVTYSDVYRIKRVYVDKGKISQVIFNLFMNAVKYSKSPETFRIEIGTEEYRHHYVIKFRDWGVGVPEEYVDRIFDDRFRAPNAKKVAGQGLGLTISRELMREHKGDLILKNREQPTEFHLIFPKKLRRSHENTLR